MEIADSDGAADRVPGGRQRSRGLCLWSRSGRRGFGGALWVWRVGHAPVDDEQTEHGDEEDGPQHWRWQRMGWDEKRMREGEKKRKRWMDEWRNECSGGEGGEERRTNPMQEVRDSTLCFRNNQFLPTSLFKYLVHILSPSSLCLFNSHSFRSFILTRSFSLIPSSSSFALSLLLSPPWSLHPCRSVVRIRLLALPLFVHNVPQLPACP